MKRKNTRCERCADIAFVGSLIQNPRRTRCTACGALWTPPKVVLKPAHNPRSGAGRKPYQTIIVN